jgi:hypothetical protein
MYEDNSPLMIIRQDKNSKRIHYKNTLCALKLLVHGLFGFCASFEAVVER